MQQPLFQEEHANSSAEQIDDNQGLSNSVVITESDHLTETEQRSQHHQG